MTPIHAGDQLDHYQIEQLVARSGMASIYRATDMSTGRPVAIKLPHPEMECDPVFFERFHREQDIGAKLNHPYILRFIALEPNKHRTHVVTEYVAGTTLTARIGKGRRQLKPAGLLPRNHT